MGSICLIRKGIARGIGIDSCTSFRGMGRWARKMRLRSRRLRKGLGNHLLSRTLMLLFWRVGIVGGKVILGEGRAKEEEAGRRAKLMIRTR